MIWYTCLVLRRMDSCLEGVNSCCHGSSSRRPHELSADMTRSFYRSEHSLSALCTANPRFFQRAAGSCLRRNPMQCLARITGKGHPFMLCMVFFTQCTQCMLFSALGLSQSPTTTEVSYMPGSPRRHVKIQTHSINAPKSHSANLPSEAKVRVNFNRAKVRLQPT